MRKYQVVVLSFCLSLGSLSYAKKLGYFFDKDLSIGETTEIVILDYDHRFGGIYQGESYKEPGEGVFYTKVGDLSKAIKKFDLKATQKNPKLIVGKKFVLNKALTTYEAPSLPEEKEKTTGDIKKVTK